MRSEKIGLPPGTLVQLGKKITEKVKITMIDYDQKKFNETIIKEKLLKSRKGVTWINIDGIHDIDVIKKIGEIFGLHPLTQEDISSTGQRPKFEEFEDYIFIVLKMLSYDKSIKSEQVSLVVGKNYVVSFQEKEGDVFEPIRERIRKDKGKIRRLGADYLAYSLVDAVVDNYFSILESFGEKIEDMEEELINDPNSSTLHKIHKLKRQTIMLRKSVWPLREVINSMNRLESSKVSKITKVYLKDVYDHTIQVIDTVETYRDVISGMMDIYLSSVSNKMNEVMKVLTIIATIFIPLTFIAGIYGMNFRYMPELDWRYGYFAVLAIMITVAISMVIYFKKKRWL
jgi:magnesium transporter